MIAGIGTDIVSVERVAAALERHGARFAERVLTEGELAGFQRANAGPGFLARRFAAKEAAVKALGTGVACGIGLRDLEVLHDARGRPLLEFHGAARSRAASLNVVERHLSISDERGYAVAFVVLVSGEGGGDP